MSTPNLFHLVTLLAGVFLLNLFPSVHGALYVSSSNPGQRLAHTLILVLPRWFLRETNQRAMVASPAR